MIDMYVQSGGLYMVCQSCGKELLPLITGVKTCSCGQKWRLSHCLGNPFAAMDLEMYGKSCQSGDTHYRSGTLIVATQ